MLAIVDYLISCILLVAAAWNHPTSAACPSAKGWFVNGVRPDGNFSCLHDADTGIDHELDNRIYCGTDELAIVTSERTVTCRARRTEGE